MDVNMESIVEEPPELLVSSFSSENDNNFGDPEILPRVGDQYQVDIPPLIIAHDDLEKRTNAKFISDIQNYFSIGLPIPIMWVHNQNLAVERVESENSEDSPITSNNEDAQLKIKFDRESGYFLVPGSSGEDWSEIECESFLLGLYIFRKNFNLVKKFAESKEMGDILGYYYGKFYRSDEYVRWSEGQKIRSKRFIHGQRIFTGWRLQELLARLFSQVSDECKNKLTEISRTFGEGKLSLEDYAFALKDAVGINKLVAAVAIGKGKKDLTSIDSTKSNNHVRPEIPSGKAWSSLTSSDIIKFLTGDFRLSKAKSHDLFWEAVWPRLLARGWHSEQPRDHIYARSKNSLVFLVPGIKKFSRRKLAKGNDYFDSVTDVLNKVTLEPALIELEFEEGNCGSDPRVNKDLEKSNEKRHCYLQPRGLNCNQDLMKFTIVDTSLVKVRELRSLPDDPINLSTLSSEESRDELEENNSINPFVDSTESTARIVDSHSLNGQDPAIPVAKTHKDRSSSVSSDRSSTVVKFQFHRTVKSLKSNYLVPIKKQRKLTACARGESRHHVENVSADTKLKKEEPFPSSKNSREEIDSVDLNFHCINEGLGKRDLTGTHSSFSCGVSTEQNGVNGRRQSTRNRPLTTRALEALECEFLVTKKKKKRKGNAEGISQNKSLSIYSRRVRAKNAADTARVCAKTDADAARNGEVGYCKEEGIDEIFG